MSRATTTIGLLVLLGAAVAFAQEKPSLADIERDIASVDTNVRVDAVAKLEATKGHVSERARLLRSLARDPAARVREEALRALERIVALDPEDAHLVSVDRLVEVMLGSGAENDRYHFVQLLESVVEARVSVAPGPLLSVAACAKNPRLRERALRVAYLAAETMPIASSDLATMDRLLAAEPETRFEAIQIAARKVEDVSIRVLVQAEATATDPQERAFVVKALDTAASSRVYEHALREIVSDSKDPRVVEAARKRLAKK